MYKGDERMDDEDGEKQTQKKMYRKSWDDAPEQNQFKFLLMEGMEILFSS